jgi:hypothetical protein
LSSNWTDRELTYLQNLLQSYIVGYDWFIETNSPRSYRLTLRTNIAVSEVNSYANIYEIVLRKIGGGLQGRGPSFFTYRNSVMSGFRIELVYTGIPQRVKEDIDSECQLVTGLIDPLFDTRLESNRNED